jgi:RHS repeat-associated protein
VTDPASTLTSMSYDAAGRETQRVMNSSGSSSSSSSSSSGGLCPSSDDANVTIQTAYNADGNVSSITAINPVTGSQTTQYVYGTVLPDSDVASSLLKRQEIYPDSVDVNDRLFFNYNRQGQVKTTKDQNGTIHTYEFDKLGRVVNDRAIVLGTGVDGAIVRIASTYDVRGLRTHLTSWDNTTIGSGSVVNDVQFAYNDFSQLITDYQAHGGAVNTSTSPRVQYAYANGSANTVRPTTLTYPNARVLNYDYGTSSGINDASSRVGSLIDNDGTTHLADYQHLGAGTFVEQDDSQPDIKWTMIDLAGSNDPDTGDIYSGFDRFGRVKDNRWYSYGASADVDRIKYGYDRASNRIWRENTVATSLSANFDELYSNDGLQRLKDMQRGRLNGGHTGLTTKTFAQCWTLDPTGNWKGFRQDDNGDGTWDLNQARTSNTVNEITNITNSVGSAWVNPAYNRAGNMTTVPKPADPTGSYAATYDAWNRLVKLVDGVNTVSEYAYDGAKRRVIQKSYTGGTLSETRHLYYTQPSQWQVIEERVGASTSAERQFVWGLRYIDDIVLRDRDTTGGGTLNERLYGMQDANWNVTAVADTSGTVQERYAYSEYGRPSFLTASFVLRTTSFYAWNDLFGGYRTDLINGLDHVRNRVLCSNIGTWLQRDKAEFLLRVNLYQYLLSRPSHFLDPSGYQELEAPVFPPEPEPADPGGALGGNEEPPWVRVPQRLPPGNGSGSSNGGGSHGGGSHSDGSGDEQGTDDEGHIEGPDPALPWDTGLCKIKYKMVVINGVWFWVSEDQEPDNIFGSTCCIGLGFERLQDGRWVPMQPSWPCPRKCKRR